MREILFRGKRIDNGEWVEGYYIKAVHHWHKRGIHEDWIITGASANGGWFAIHNRHAVDPETVGQYTGLTDKNGKKIFEGDIVRGAVGDMIVFYGEIAGVGYGFQWEAVDGKPCESMTGFIDEYEVIGNIHDDPELLEG